MNIEKITNEVVDEFIKELNEKQQIFFFKKCNYCSKYVYKLNKKKQCKLCMYNTFYFYLLRDKMII